MKKHDLYNVVIDGQKFNYFYTKAKRDVNGNSRWNVYIIDPDGPAVYEEIFKCYESQIEFHVEQYISELLF